MTGGSALRAHAERVPDYLVTRGKPLSACDILAGLRSASLRAPAMICSALDWLVAAGLVHRIDSLDAWTPCKERTDAQTPVFAICETRGGVSAHVDLRLVRDVAALARSTGFAPRRSVIEISGRCGACRSAEPADRRNRP